MKAPTSIRTEPMRIERGVPLPERPAPYTTQRAQFPFAKMGIGDSFETEKASVASAAKKYRDRMAARGELVVLVVRKQPNGKYRCWRQDPGAVPVARTRKGRPARLRPALREAVAT